MIDAQSQKAFEKEVEEMRVRIQKDRRNNYIFLLFCLGLGIAMIYISTVII